MLQNSLTLYNPGEKDKKALIDEFVVRQEVLEDILTEIRREIGNRPTHFLIVAQRGAGKTTLLCRVKYAIEDDPSLSDSLIAVNLGEEQYHISELSDLWISVATVLEDYYSFKKLSEALFDVDNEAPNLQYEILERALGKKGKRLVLFIENVGDLLKKLPRAQVENLRSMLKESQWLQVIAGTPISLENTLEELNVSFDFFKTIELQGLSTKETETLLLKLAETHGELDRIRGVIKNNPERIEILRRLTGGVVRTMVLLFKVFLESEDGRSIKDLQQVLDSVTPLYKHRMDDLPAQQQKIVDIVAKQWDAISVKDISSKSNIPSKVVSAQLRQLEKNNIITKVSTDSKNNLYQLRERFLNIWYLMRYGRRYDKKRVIWLVKFFEAWLTKQELEDRIRLHIENLQSKKYDANAAVLMGETYVACGVDPAIKEKLIQATANLYPQEFDATRFDLDDDILKEAEELLKSRKNDEALRKLDSLQNLTEKNYRSVTVIATKSNDYFRALRTLQEAEKKGFTDAVDHSFIGIILENEFKDFNAALKYYYKAQELGEDTRPSIARLMYRHLDQVDEAENILNALISQDPGNPSHYSDLGELYTFCKQDPNKGIELMKKAVALGDADSNLRIAEIYHYGLKDFNNAEIYYERDATEAKFIGLARINMDLKNDKPTAIQWLEKAINERYYSAYIDLGLIYEKENDFTKALNYYQLAIDRTESVRPYHRMAHIYAKNDSTLNKAEEYFKIAIAKGDENARGCLAIFYCRNQNLSDAISVINEFKLRRPNDPYAHELSAAIKLKANEFDEVIEDLKVVIENEQYVEEEIADVGSIIIDLLAVGEYDRVLTLFSNEKTRDIFKPIYFALMKIMRKDFPTEYLKMGDEMAQTVKEILDKINEGASGRNGKKIKKGKK